MTSRRLLVIGLVTLLAAAAPARARAEHNTAPPSEPSAPSAKVEVPGTEHSLDLNLKLLHKVRNTYLDEEPGEPLPSNVIRFRVGRAR